jgi:hypothetical protein
MTLTHPSHELSYGYGCGQPSAYAVNTRVQCMYPWIAHRVPSLAPGIAPAAPPAPQAAAALPPPPSDANGMLLFTLQASSVAPSLVAGLATGALPAVVATQLASWGVPASRVGVAVTDASVFAMLLVTNAPLGLWNSSTMAAFATGLATDVGVAPSAVTAGCADVVSTSNIVAGRRKHRRLLTAPPSIASPVLVPVYIGGLSANASLAAALATQLNGGSLAVPRALSAWLAATQRQAFPALAASSPASSQAPAATVATTLLVAVYLLPSMTAADAASASATLAAAMASGSMAAGVASAIGANCTFAFGPVSLTPAPLPPATLPGASASPPPPPPPPPPVLIVVNATPSSSSSSGTLIGLGVGIACGVVCIGSVTWLAVVVARRRRARHMDSVEKTIHRVRSTVLMEGLAAGEPMARILTHPSMVNITALELQAVAQVCLKGLQPRSPAWATKGEEEDTVPQELRVPSGPRRSMVRMSAPGEAEEEGAYEDSAALEHLHHIEMRLSTASYQGRISQVSSTGSAGARREPRLTSFDPYAIRRTSLMLEATLHRLSSTSSTEWTDQDEAEVWRMSEVLQLAGGEVGSGVAWPVTAGNEEALDTEPDEAPTDADGTTPSQ